MKILNFKTKQQKAKDWLNKAMSDENFKKVKKAVLLYQTEEGETVFGKYECDYFDVMNFQTELNAFSTHLFLKENINEYIQYIE